MENYLRITENINGKFGDNLFCRNMKKNLEMVIMMNNDGRLTAIVHIAEPQMLPVAV